MSKREDAKEILKSLGLPKQQQNERSCLTLLALAGLLEESSWAKTKRPLLRIWDIMVIGRPCCILPNPHSGHLAITISDCAVCDRY